MWIKWKYNDHGHPDFKELEIPTETYSGKTYYGGEASVEEYICELGLVPTWSERFDGSRIKWQKIRKPSKETILNKIDELKNGISWRKKKLKELNKLIK